MRKTSSSAVFRGPPAYSQLLWLSWVSWGPAPKEIVMEGREPGANTPGKGPQSHKLGTPQAGKPGAQMLFWSDLPTGSRPDMTFTRQ